MRHFTIWQFRSVDGKQTAIVVRVSEPNDRQVQHEYQQILGQAYAISKAAALDSFEPLLEGQYAPRGETARYAN